MGVPPVQTGAPRGQRGSILVLVLFACLAVTVVIQSLCAVIICAQRATADEYSGRVRLEAKDQALATLREMALTRWQATAWTLVRQGAPGDEPSDGGPGGAEGALTELHEEIDWAMQASARQDPSFSRLVVSSVIERGRDGVDLPLAALVADRLSAAADRETFWLSVDPGPSADGGSGAEASSGGGAIGYVRNIPAGPVLGDGCSLLALSRGWRLDPGWAELRPITDIDEVTAGRIDGTLPDDPALPTGVAPGPYAAVLSGRPGQTVHFPDELGSGTAEQPILVIVTGGATLDARGRGDLYGVLVVDDGSVRLDGTSLHGAVFATDAVELGETGTVLFSRSILRWATDRSLLRTRLVPGTRREEMD